MYRFEISNNSFCVTIPLQTIPDDENVDESYKYYDNVRGKINNAVLTELVEK